jgi:hypothetical protein
LRARIEKKENVKVGKDRRVGEGGSVRQNVSCFVAAASYRHPLHFPPQLLPKKQQIFLKPEDEPEDRVLLRFPAI